MTGAKNDRAFESLRSVGLRGLAVAASAYVGVTILLGACQKRMIYFPLQGSAGELAKVARLAGLTPWHGDDRDGPLLGYRTTTEKYLPPNRLVVFHGNAGYALHRLYFARGFGGLEGGRLWQVHLFEYPGYGARPGTRGEKEFVRAASDAIAQLRLEDDRPVFLLGESIGSGVACALAAARADDVAGLFLVTPFTSLPDVAAFHYPYLPVRLILRERYDNVAALTKYRGPVAFLAAGRDSIIPPGSVQTLHDGFTGPKRLWVQPHAGHNDLDYAPDAPSWSEVSDFLLREGRSEG